mgnify:FL=1
MVAGRNINVATELNLDIKSITNQVFVGKGEIIGKGVYATRDIQEGEVVIQYGLEPLTEEDYEKLSEEEKAFVHTHWGVKYIYSEPERYVNHSSNPNTLQDLENKCDVAIRDIKQGEQITTDATKDNI